MSLICKGGSITYGAQAIGYAGQKMVNGVQVAHEFDRRGVAGATGQEIWNEMLQWQRMNGHDDIKRGLMWCSFSPSQDFCEFLERENKWHEALEMLLKRVGLDNTQRVCIMHDRTEREDWRKHIHIAANRVDNDGRVISDKMFGLKCKDAADWVARHYGFAEARTLDSDKKRMKETARQVLRSMPSFDLSKFLSLLDAEGIHSITHENEAGEVTGYSLYEDKDHIYKSSQVWRPLTPIHVAYTWEDERKKYLDILNKQKQQEDVQRLDRGQKETEGAERNEEIKPEQQQKTKPEQRSGGLKL